MYQSMHIIGEALCTYTELVKRVPIHSGFLATVTFPYIGRTVTTNIVLLIIIRRTIVVQVNARYFTDVQVLLYLFSRSNVEV